MYGCGSETLGILDYGFGTAGMIVGPTLPSTYSVNDIQLDLQNKLLFGGANSVGTRYYLSNADLNLNANTSFASSGFLLGNWPSANDRINKIVVQPDKKIVVCGNTGSAPADSAVMRVNSDGSIDTAFGTAGTTVVDYFANSNECTDVTLQQDGKILSIGRALNGAASYDYSITRYRTDGALDTTFATGGKYSLDYASATDTPNAILLESNGNMVLIGGSFSGALTIKAIRLDSSGTLDTTFGLAGTFTHSIAGITSANTKKILKDNSGNYYFVGNITAAGTTAARIFKTDSTGTLDTTFGTAGTATFFPSGYSTSGVADAYLQSDGKIVVLGGFTTPYGYFVARYTTSGQLDTSFGQLGTGYRITLFPSYVLTSAMRLFLLSDNRFYVFGIGYNGTSYFPIAQRYR
jgi:uncharacterized delta-60 repeat protein